MRSRRNILIFAAAVVGVLLLALLLRPAVAGRPTFDDKNILFQDDFQLDGPHDGDLVVVGNTLTLAALSRVGGDASLIGNKLIIAGTVDGDVNAAGKEFTLAPGAQVRGDLSATGSSILIGGKVGGSLNLSGASVTVLQSAVIDGDFSVCGVSSFVDQRANAAAPECLTPTLQPLSQEAKTAGLLALAVVGALALTGMSALSVTLFPRQISRIEEAMRARPRSFGGVGLATYALALGLFAAMMFLLAVLPPLGLLLVPVFLILSLLLFLLCATGLVTVTVMLGDWLLRRRGGYMPPLIAGVVGSLALSALVFVVALLPFGAAISFVVLAGLSSVGLGASIFTRIGTRPVGRTYFIQG